MNNLFFCNNRTALTLPEKNRESKSPKKLDFNKLKNNTFKSLNEVEFFLNDFNRFKKYVTLYKIFK